MKMSCHLCQRPVRMKALTGIECGGQVWHKKCFQCSLCRQQLSLRSYRRHGDLLYCHKHLPSSENQRISTPAQPPTPTTRQPPANSFPVQPPTVNACWFHGEMDREDAEKLLQKDGDFLVRASKGRQGDYVVTVKWNSKPYNFICPKTPNGGWNFDGEELRRLEDWVQRHVETVKPVCSKSGAKLLRPIANSHIYDEIADSVLNHHINAGTSTYQQLNLPAVPARAVAPQQPQPPAERRKAPYEEVVPARPPTTGVPVCEKRKTSVRGLSTDDISVEIVPGNICQMKVDVIVNSVGAHMNLKQGALSSALLAIAGDEIQTELSRIAPAFVKPGDVFVTKGYKLDCKNVIHAVCYKFKDGEQSTVQGYRQLIKSILTEADKLKATSIAIPPIGTGALGYPATIVAKVMTEEIAALSESCTHPTLKDIRFVMLGTDAVTYKAYSAALEPDNDTGDSEEISEDYINDVAAQRALQLRETQKLRSTGFDLPNHWISKESGKQYEKFELKPQTKEYDAVVKNITDRDGVRYAPYIHKIERIENHDQFMLYNIHKSLSERNRKAGTIIERTLWHGTSFHSLENICLYGFNRAYCGKNGVLYGRGVYCAHDFSYSANDTYSPPDTHGLKYIIQCRVLTGDYVTGTADMIEPPEKSPGIKYDSTVDDVTDPRIFVVFYDNRMYPEYIITFFG